MVRNPDFMEPGLQDDEDLFQKDLRTANLAEELREQGVPDLADEIDDEVEEDIEELNFKRKR